MTSNVLVVGDDQSRWQSVRRACDEAGLANPLVRCRGAAEARSHLGLHGPTHHPAPRRGGPAVVVTDLRLPDGCGLELLGALRRHLPLRRTPVVVIGDDATDPEIDQVHRAGAAVYLSAAVVAGSLLDVVRDMRTPWSLEPVGAQA